MSDARDVRRLALALDGVEEVDSDGFDFRAFGRGIVWSYPERVPGRGRVIRTDIAVLYVGDLAEQQALVLGEPDVFFIVPDHEWRSVVLVRLEQVGRQRLSELVGDAWRMRAEETAGR